MTIIIKRSWFCATCRVHFRTYEDARRHEQAHGHQIVKVQTGETDEPQR